ncbi:thioesterase family protein [Nocardioides sp. YIM 152315]|uniref:thioesterase family protein n=1 Tax=Nocardioides sp. YIM 152315 TaxID=3031760 RepID=UPI0023DB65A2|nr:thioesterase family protein [Nocardioides sp. YIM 152315]MDF1606048.1 thioesterase family protein [Nocardioides sp. YIM 152315]
MKSTGTPVFYRSSGAFHDPSGAVGEAFESLSSSVGPWSPDSQHGGPPAALLARSVERLSPARIGRFTMELLGPVPVGPVAVTASVLRPGRSVQLVGAELHDVARGRVAASARAWLFPDGAGPGAAGPPPPHGPGDGAERPRPSGWHGGYLDAIEWRWVRGGLEEPGSGVVWMRSPGLVEGEPISPVQRLLACVDSASGVSAALDVRQWGFLNTELSVHVLREPVGEWVCLDAETTLSDGATGVATSAVYDERGLVARSAQALLVVPRHGRGDASAGS